MGYLTAHGIGETDLSIEQQVSWHFSSNCYPPVPAFMIPVAVKAIEAVLEGNVHEELDLPEEVTFREKNTASVFDLVENLYLFGIVDGLLDKKLEEENS